MTDGISSAVADFTEKPTSIETLTELCNAFQANEVQRAPKNVHPLPYHYGYSEINQTLRQRLVDTLSSFAGGNNQAAAILSISVQMRLHSAQSKHIQAICASITPEDIAKLPAIALLEACNILQAQRDWAKLSFCAKDGAHRANISVHQQYFYCDWFVLAGYKMLVPLFERNELASGHVDQLEETMNSVTTVLPQGSKNRIFYRAVIANLRNDLDLAVDLALEAQRAEGFVIGLFHRLECFVNPMTIADAKSAGLNELHESCQHNLIHDSRNDPVLLISTDQNYFSKFFGSLLESFAYWNPGGLLHLHCVAFAPDPSSLKAFEAQHGVRINYSTDEQGLVPKGSKNFNGYCAGARYIHLPYYLEHYGWIIITDIDGVIRSDIGKAWHHNQNAILLTGKPLDPKWKSTRLIWETFAAGSFGIARTPKNQQFATVLANYLCSQIFASNNTGTPFFCTDQIGLLLGYLRFKNQCIFEPCQRLYAQGGNWRFSEQDGKSIAQGKMDFRKK